MNAKGRALTNAALLLAAIALGALVWNRPQHRPPRARPPLAALAPHRITDITITRPGHPMIRLQRAGTGWLLERPFKARADRFRVEALTDIGTARPSDRFPAPQTSLAGFGLAPPMAVVSFGHQPIAIGRRRPFGDLRYVRVGNTIALVPAEIIHPRRLTSDSFVSTRLLGSRVHPVAFTLPRFRVVRHHGVWGLDPNPPGLSHDRINAFVDKWRYARALAVTRYHGARPIGQVVIRYEQGSLKKAAATRTLVIDIIATHPELLLVRRDQGLEYHFPEQVGDQLLHMGRHAGAS